MERLNTRELLDLRDLAAHIRDLAKDQMHSGDVSGSEADHWERIFLESRRITERLCKIGSEREAGLGDRTPLHLSAIAC